MTKMSNPHFLPEVFIWVTIINFTVTESGLAEQLLSQIMMREKPDQEQKKSELVLNIARDQKKVKSIEDDILSSLANSETNILDDKDLIQKLDESKIISAEIQNTMKENEIAQVVIEETWNRYQVIADRGALLYFVIQDLSNIDPMYQYSLTYFINLFNNIIEISEKSDDD